MNADEIKWISCYDKDIGPINQSLCEKVEKFGYCLVLDEFGSDKATKVQLCVLDTVLKKEKPNILLICPSHFMHSWYKTLVSEIGIDFKMISGSSRAVAYFTDTISNLLIMSEDALLNAQHSPVMQDINGSDIVWDMVIIDASLAVNGIDSNFYIENIKGKAEKLIIFSPVPCGYQESYDGIRNIVKALLSDDDKAATVDDVAFDVSTICFDVDTPIMRYYATSVYEGDLKRKVVVEKYKFDEDWLSNSRHMVDLKTGLPLYTHGGNIFEEYGLEKKKVYTKPVYTIADVGELREVDKKLDVFLNKMDAILENAENRVVIYCMCNSTIEYLRKVLLAAYPNQSNLLKTDKGHLFNTKAVINRFENNQDVETQKIIITVDAMGTNDASLRGATHIINYEIPDNPVVFEQRSARHGARNETWREFIVFCDENGVFDSRMLAYVLFGKIYRGILTGLPGRNVLFDLPNAPELMAMMFKELRYVNGFTGEVNNCFDLIMKFRCDFNVKKELKLDTATQVHEYTTRKLNMLYKALDIEKEMSKPEIDDKSLRALMKTVFEKYDGALLYLDEEQKIIAIHGDELKECLYGEQYNEYKAQIQKGEIVMGLKQAKESLANYITENKSSELRVCIEQLSENLKLPVLLNVWRFLRDGFVFTQTFRQFIKNYNEGVM